MYGGTLYIYLCSVKKTGYEKLLENKGGCRFYRIFSCCNAVGWLKTALLCDQSCELIEEPECF